MWDNIQKWNKIIYRDPNKLRKGSLTSEDLWAKFKIKSGPKFKDECWSEIPGVWADDVSDFIKSVQSEFGNKVRFLQIKEKFCELTVYYSSPDNIKKRVHELIEECIEKLIKKGVHPPKLGEKND